MTAASKRQPPAFDLTDWLRSVYCHESRPPALQRDVLTALAVKFANRAGEGYASVEALAGFCRVSRSTVQRALRWARTAGLLQRKSRGHRLGNGKVLASEWQLRPQGVTRGLLT
jgi:hypothetical protein